MNMESASDFKKKIGSRARVLLTSSKITGATSATLPGGAVVEKVSKPSYLPTQENLAIWKVTSGEVPTSGEDFDPRTVRRLVGGSEAPAGHTKHSINFSLWNRFQANWKAGNSSGARRVYHEACLTLLTLVFHQDKTLYDTLMSIVDRDAVATWYIAIDLVPASMLQGWTETHVASPETHMLKFFTDPAAAMQHCSPAAAGAAIFANPRGVSDAIRAQAESLLQSDCRAPRTYGDVIKEVYAAALSSNSIGSVSNVWPAGVCAALASRKAWQDLLRLHIKLLFAGSEASELPVELHALVHETLRGANHEEEFDRLASGKGEVGTSDKETMTLLLPGSTNFLYFPRPSALVAEMGRGGDPRKPPQGQDTHNAEAIPEYVLKQAASGPQEAPWAL
jgi:hypothetical protein